MFNISSSYNRKKPINNIYSSLKFCAFVHIKSHFSFSAHHCSGATPKSLAWPAGHTQMDPRDDGEEAPAANAWDEQRQQWGWTELCRSASPPCRGDRPSSRDLGGSRCHHLCPPGTGQQLPLGMPLLGSMRGSFRPLLPRWHREQGNINLGLTPRKVQTQPGTHSPLSPGCHLCPPSGTALHPPPASSEAALLSNP